jgi:hypothetical protein
MKCRKFKELRLFTIQISNLFFFIFFNLASLFACFLSLSIRHFDINVNNLKPEKLVQTYIVGQGAWLPLSNKQLRMVRDYVKLLLIIRF